MTMMLPANTILLAAVLGLLGAWLTIQVILARGRSKVAAGDGGNAGLAQAIRAHGNFTEQVPMALLLIGGVELLGYAPAYLYALGAALIVARLFSAFGLSASLEDRLPRRIGAGLTITVVIVAAALILLRSGGFM